MGWWSSVRDNVIVPTATAGLVGGPLAGSVAGTATGAATAAGGDIGGIDPFKVTSTAPQLNAFQQAQLPYFQEQLPLAQQLYQGGQLGQVAPFSPFQTYAQQGALGTAQNFGQNVNPMLQGALGFGLNGALNVQNNPFLNQAILAAQQPTIQSFNEGVQNIGSAAQRAGAYGGSRQGVLEANLARDFGQTLANQAATMGSNAYGQGLNVFSNTLSQAPAISGLPFNVLNQLNAYGGQQQGQAQAQLDQQRNALQQRQSLLFPGGAPGAVGQPTSQPSPFMQLAGLGIAGAGAIAPFLKPTGATV